jgi:anaerobic selenocysteine-containing dehydrogenase
LHWAELTLPHPCIYRDPSQLSLRRHPSLCNSSSMSILTPHIQVTRGVCPHDCPDTCAMRVTVQNGVAIKVQGDPEHLPTHGALCTKVSRYPERTHHPERVLYPLKRRGPKGSGLYARVGWDEA